MAPFSLTPLGAIKSKTALNFWFSIAPTVISKGKFSVIFPTSLSSTFPSKIIFSTSAIVAMVVPSLKLFDSMTWLPTFTGMSKIIPDTVALISVLAAAPNPFAVPVFTISKVCFAAVSITFS